MRKFNSGLKAILLVVVLAVTPAAVWAQDDWQNRELERMQTFLNLMDSFFGIIENMHAVSSDAERAAVFQLYKIEEIYKERGERARAIEVFRQVLDETQNPAIRNAAYILLGEALKETGRADEAVDTLQQALRENLRNAQ